ncbi:C-5 cytosine-specific DNA methylase [Nostoc linckia NIES-25]|nr:C-5 cytosine-specific DNA methylase [Nostoc linckia NIES-25]BAY78673.1 C-5 cytosine-specific DNA methylase [Nostoc linckia NIES-25]BAY78701.1 C-5 cytosine-specific DNA methylase [Nostoc linckia NIES-25]
MTNKKRPPFEVATNTRLKNIMKQNSPVPGQLALFDIPSVQISKPQHDPYWDEITAPQHSDSDRWNPAHFGETPFKPDGDQLTIFYDDSDEPPAPDDYQNLDDYNEAWREWELRVGAQVTISTTVEPLVGAQVALDTKKVAPQHDTHWVEKYWVERGTNKYWYYRYCWMFGRKKHRRYLGSVDSPKAKFRKSEIENAIADGQCPAEIQELIRSWRQQSPVPNL